MKKALLILVLLSTSIAFSQNNSLWEKATPNSAISQEISKRQLQKSVVYTLNIEALKVALLDAPKRQDFTNTSSLILSFPNSNGELEQFRVFEASNFSEELQRRYPDIRSYAGQGITDPTSIIRFSISPIGFQSMQLSALKSATFIEQITNDISVHVAFNRGDRMITDNFECEVTETIHRRLGTTVNRNADDGILRTFRLAVSTTGEYTTYHGGTKPLALAAINNTMARVNGIFEVDFNVTMVLISNTDDVIYTNAGSDPYTGSYNSQLQSTLTSVIGEANYDIGHLFVQAGNNGNAGCIGCVCVNGQKGSAFTSAVNPIGDFFDVDYVAHEMGHQFGANHTWTFNGNEGTNVQVEPGSGTTIMSYAGITGATDVEPNVTPNFHAVSIEQVTDYVKSTSCQTDTPTGNSVPTANAGSNYTIPNGTAFILEGSGSDADPLNVLSYSWEQMDENNASTTYPSTTATSGVAFRAYEPTTDSYRYFPRLETIKTGATSWQWEAVPTVARTLNFRLTVRDNVAGGGTNNSDDMIVTVNGTAGPFVLNSPNTSVTWDTGSTQTILWDVAGTTANGINAANVDIFLSTDGGDSYPIQLASNVANDGSHDITVPNNPGTQNRIMVRGSNHIFFDISNTNFTINLSTPTFLLSATPDNNESCAPLTADYTVDLTSLLGFNSPVTLSTTGLPTGATEIFSVNPVTPTGSSVLTIDPGTASFGTYTVTISGTGSGITQTFDISYTISAGVLGSVVLSTPTDGALSVGTSPTLSWNTEVNADSYEIDVATDVGFSNIIFNQSGINTNSAIVPGLSYNTDYFWRVRAVNNCVTGGYSSVWQFTTQDVPACTGTQITSFPYLETFDSGLGDWSDATGDDGNWTNSNGGTPSGGTGPSDDITGGQSYYFLEASNNGSPGEVGANATVILNSPCYDLSGLTEAYFSFYYHMYGANVGTLDLEITADNGVSWINVFNATGNLGDYWNGHNIDLSSYIGQSVKFRFIGLTGNGWSSDIAIDHIGVGDPIVPPVTPYCDSNGNNTNDEFIGSVELNTLSNLNSGAGTTSTGYSDFTSDPGLTTTLFGGTQYTITITPVWTGTIYDEGYRVWIDYNNDGDFFDSGEEVLSVPPSQTTPIIGVFTVPIDISYGSSTRMRVSLKYNGLPDPCESFDYGEVEDYTVSLAYDGLLYMNNTWAPNAPSSSTGSDNALVLNGTYSVDSDIALNDLLVHTGATVDVVEGESISLNGDLSNNGDLVLNSTSMLYSSLIVNGAATGDVVYNRHVNINASVGERDLISAPVTGQTFANFAAPNTNLFENPGNPTEKLFGPFDKTTGTYLTYDTNIPAEAGVILDPGIGYRAASTDDGTFEFRGVVNTGPIGVNISNSGSSFAEWNLVGNPFPSYILLSDFLADNSLEFFPSNAGVYGYDGDASDGWKIWNVAYSLLNPNAVIAPGQGFLVSSKIEGGTMTFNSAIRTISTGNSVLDDDFIDGRATARNEISYLRLRMSSDSETYPTDFYFTDLASSGLDIGFDATVFNNVAPNFAIYSHLVEDNEGHDIAIQSVRQDDLYNDIIIPLGINASLGQQLNISIETSILPEDIDVYLEDNLTNTFTLLNTGDYNFIADSNISGTGRFFLRFDNQTLGNTDFDNNELIVYTTTNPKEVLIKGSVLDNTNAILYDIHGRVILSQLLNPNKNIQTMNVSSLSTGVYIIKIQNDNSVHSQKLIIR